jgi:SAM-dependent methyltransferase
VTDEASMQREIEAELGPLLPQVSRELSPHDEMFAFGRNWTGYLWIAASALRCIRRSMSLVGKQDAHRILDLASGHGRVLRVLRVAFPAAATTACDVNADGVRFCAVQFGATPVVSHADPAHVKLEGPFDLVWCGSLFTHLDAPRWDGFLELIESVLEPDALFVFTVFGAQIAESWRGGVPDPQLTREDIEQILRGYDQIGFGYADYPGEDGWGDALVTPEWVRATIERRNGLRFVDHWATGWVGSQDVVTCLGPPVA